MTWQPPPCTARAWSIFRDLDDRHGIAEALGGAAVLAASQDDAARAVRLAAAAAVLREALNAPLAPMAQTAFDRGLARARLELSDFSRAAAEFEGRAMTLQQAVDYALEAMTP